MFKSKTDKPSRFARVRPGRKTVIALSAGTIAAVVVAKKTSGKPSKYSPTADSTC